MAASRAKDGLFYSTAAVVLVSALVQTAYSQGVVVTPVNSTAVSVDWAQFLTTTTRTNTVFVIIRRTDYREPFLSSIQQLLVYSDNVRNTVLGRLQSGRSYRIEIWGIVALQTRRGVVHIQEDQATANVTMLSAKPSGVVDHVEVEPSSRSINISWEFSSYEAQNGPITHYVLLLQVMSSGRYGNTQSVVTRVANVTYPDREVHSFSLTNQDHGVGIGKRYRVRIAARNANGTGPFTEWIYTRTHFKVPLSPQLVVVSTVEDTLHISWLPSVEPEGNPVTGFRVRYTQLSQDREVEGESTVAAEADTLVVVPLAANTTVVHASVEAYNEDGYSQPLHKTTILSTTNLLNTSGIDNYDNGSIVDPSSVPTNKTKDNKNNNRNKNNNNTGILGSVNNSGPSSGVMVGVAAGSALAGILVGVVAVVTLEGVVYWALRKGKKENSQQQLTSRSVSIQDHSQDDMKANDYETLRHLTPGHHPVYSSLTRNYDIPANRSDTPEKLPATPTMNVSVYEMPTISRGNSTSLVAVPSFPRVYDSADSDLSEHVVVTTTDTPTDTPSRDPPPRDPPTVDDYDSAYCEMHPVSILGNTGPHPEQASDYLEPASLN